MDRTSNSPFELVRTQSPLPDGCSLACLGRIRMANEVSRTRQGQTTHEEGVDQEIRRDDEAEYGDHHRGILHELRHRMSLT